MNEKSNRFFWGKLFKAKFDGTLDEIPVEKAILKDSYLFTDYQIRVLKDINYAKKNGVEISDKYCPYCGYLMKFSAIGFYDEYDIDNRKQRILVHIKFACKKHHIWVYKDFRNYKG